MKPGSVLLVLFLALSSLAAWGESSVGLRVASFTPASVLSASSEATFTADFAPGAQFSFSKGDWEFLGSACLLLHTESELGSGSELERSRYFIPFAQAGASYLFRFAEGSVLVPVGLDLRASAPLWGPSGSEATFALAARAGLVLAVKDLDLFSTRFDANLDLAAFDAGGDYSSLLDRGVFGVSASLMYRFRP